MNTSQTPPGGWIFYQPQTGWTAPSPVGNTHDQQVVNIIKHRLANPAVTAKHRLATDFNNVANELQRFTEMRLGIPAAPKSMPPPPEQPHVAGAVAEAVRNVKKLAGGAALLLEWQESGEPPVSIDVASERAKVCETCPKNDTTKRLSDYFTIPVANEIRKKLEKLHALNLHTPNDSTLGTCSACLCPLPLKVWTPLHLILSRLKQDQKADLDPRCWILRRN